jgi:hypothetical protein
MHVSSYTANTDGDVPLTRATTLQILLSCKRKYQSVHPYIIYHFVVNTAMILLLVPRKMSKHSSANPPPPLGHRYTVEVIETIAPFTLLRKSWIPTLWRPKCKWENNI